MAHFVFPRGMPPFCGGMGKCNIEVGSAVPNISYKKNASVLSEAEKKGANYNEPIRITICTTTKPKS